MTIGVYMIEHIDSGRRYVGKSVDVQQRIRTHFTPGQSQRSASRIHAAIRKYGRDAFRWLILEDCADDATAQALEILWIRGLNTKTPNGFNLTDGGEGSAGCRPSSETRARLATALRGNKRRAGKVASEETREKMRAAHLGKTHTPEARAKMSASQKGRVRSAEAIAKHAASLRGHKMSAETCAKMSQSRRGRKHSAETREKMRQAWARRKELSNGC